MHKLIWLYIGVMIVTTYMVRTLPLTLFRKKFESRFLRSFLYYVPYVTLSVMTFPAILHVTGNPMVGMLAFIGALAAAMSGLGLFPVSVICSAIVLVLSCIGL